MQQALVHQQHCPALMYSSCLLQGWGVRRHRQGGQCSSKVVRNWVHVDGGAGEHVAHRQLGDGSEGGTPVVHLVVCEQQCTCVFVCVCVCV